MRIPRMTIIAEVFLGALDVSTVCLTVDSAELGNEGLVNRAYKKSFAGEQELKHEIF